MRKLLLLGLIGVSLILCYSIYQQSIIRLFAWKSNILLPKIEITKEKAEISKPSPISMPKPSKIISPKEEVWVCNERALIQGFGTVKECEFKSQGSK